MDIHYHYTLSNNLPVLNNSPGSFAHTLLWLIPVMLVVSYFKQRHTLQKLALALLITCLLFYWEHHSISSRFGSISYHQSGVTLIQKNGHIINLTPQQITRFRSITITSNAGTWGCYLQVNTADKSYRSYLVDTYSHSCLQDANKLNLYFAKTLPRL